MLVLKYNAIIYFNAQIAPELEVPFKLPSVYFWHVSFFFEDSLTFWHKRCSTSYCSFLAPVLESSNSLSNPCPF